MSWLTQNWVWIVVAIGLIWMMRRGGMPGCGMGHSGHGSEQGKDTAPEPQKPLEPGSKTAGASQQAPAGQEPRKQRHHGC